MLISVFNSDIVWKFHMHFTHIPVHPCVTYTRSCWLQTCGNKRLGEQNWLFQNWVIPHDLKTQIYFYT